MGGGFGAGAPLAVEGGVGAVAGDEVVVRAVFDEEAVVEDEDGGIGHKGAGDGSCRVKRLDSAFSIALVARFL